MHDVRTEFMHGIDATEREKRKIEHITRILMADMLLPSAAGALALPATTYRWCCRIYDTVFESIRGMAFESRCQPTQGQWNGMLLVAAALDTNQTFEFHYFIESVHNIDSATVETFGNGHRVELLSHFVN